jgi:proteasome accessory factor A
MGSESTNLGNEGRVLSRTIGLETEYALVLVRRDRDLRGESSHQLPEDWYARLIAAMAKHSALVRGLGNSTRFFNAQGGSISREVRWGAEGGIGFLEGATPECLSPRDLIAHQVAQDELFASLVEQIPPTGEIRLLKNSADHQAHLYGQQENYDLTIASGWRLLAWRCALLLLFLPIQIYYLLSTLWLGLMGAAMRWTHRDPEPWLDSQLQRGSAWLDIASTGLRLLHYPLACIFSLLAWGLLCVPHRRRMSGFLASRSILEGSGYVDSRGKFWLSAKAATVRSEIGMGAYFNRRPIFEIGHLLESVCAHPIQGWIRLWQPRQRIQLALGDSSPNPWSQYLKVATTCLVLDLVEARSRRRLVHLQRAWLACQEFSGDATLVHRTAGSLEGGRSRDPFSALEIQMQTLQAVRGFLEDQGPVPEECWSILAMWKESLEALRQHRYEQPFPDGLLGKIDWATKQWLLEKLGRGAPWEARKKLDLRYAELSEEGYCEKVRRAHACNAPVDRQRINLAKQSPPEGTAARARAYWIREFASERQDARVDWDRGELLEEGKRRTFHFRPVAAGVAGKSLPEEEPE